MEIETGRLLLRPISSEDIDEFLALHQDPAVTRFISAFDRAQSEERLARSDREWAERGHGLLGVFERGDDAFLGRTGLKHWPQFGDGGETEIGWVLRRSAWGRGYAHEAASACLEWAFGEFDFPYVTAMIGPGNDRSVRVAEKLGFRPIREDSLLGDPVTVWAKAHP